MQEEHLVPTPYDDAFRTLLNDCADLIIPVINEIFGYGRQHEFREDHISGNARAYR